MEFLLVFILQGLLVDACHKIIYGKRTISANEDVRGFEYEGGTKDSFF